MLVSEKAATCCSVLTIEEFADFFKIGRTKVYDLIKEQKLVLGRHYIKFGDKVRFPLRDALIDVLLEDSPALAGSKNLDAAVNNDRKEDEKSTPRSVKRRGRGGINLDY